MCLGFPGSPSDPSETMFTGAGPSPGDDGIWALNREEAFWITGQ